MLTVYTFLSPTNLTNLTVQALLLTKCMKMLTLLAFPLPKIMEVFSVSKRSLARNGLCMDYAWIVRGLCMDYAYVGLCVD